jgi:hypothetical protein
MFCAREYAAMQQWPNAKDACAIAPDAAVEALKSVDEVRRWQRFATKAA